MKVVIHARKIRPLLALTVLAASVAVAAPPGRQLSRVLDVNSAAAQEELASPAPSSVGPSWGTGGNSTTVLQPQPDDDGCITCGDGCCDDGACDSCCDDCCGDMWHCNRCGPGGVFFGGADYLLARPRMSQAVAEVRETQSVTTTSGGTVDTSRDQTVAFPFRYQSGFRAFLGYRLLSCGGDLQFTYWNLTGGATVTDGPAEIANGTRIIFGQLLNNPGEGQFLTATQHVTANIYDLDFIKCLSLGGSMGPCDSCGCPRWDVRWLGGVRIGDVRRSDNNVVFDARGADISNGFIQANFTGVGPHVGMQGRRYFGPNSRLSFYSKVTGALLIGDLHMNRSLITPGTSPVPTEDLQSGDKFARIVPVTDIEIGATWQVACRAFISAGWFWQAWWDLGASENICPNQLNFCSTLDSSNILGFDGLFIRGEVMF